MIKWFKDITEADFELVGGKGYNLAKMFNQGMQVPNGFVILSTAYDTYGSLESVDETLMEEVYKAFDKMESGLVAVRSSSTVEDLPGLSFAGQYSTYLEVTRDDLKERIRGCWDSLNNERAIEYRLKNKITEGYSHAVVVQEMVNSHVSGIAFTSNPVSGVRDELVLNTAFGLGEAIVSGQVTPDHYLVDKSSGEIIESTLKENSLDGSMLKKLLEVCGKTEAFFGKPQDIEFAFDTSCKLFLLQSRDITTLFPMDAFERDDKFRAYLNTGTVMLGMKEPFTPLGFSIMSTMFPTIINVITARKKNLLTNSFVKHNAYRMYVDITYLMSSKFIAKQFANSFSGNDLPLKGVMNSVIEKYGNRFKGQGYRFRLPLGIIKYSIGLTGKLREIKKIPNAERYAAIRALGDKAFAVQKKIFDELRTDEERVSFAKEVLVEAFKLSQTMAMYCLDVNNLIKIEKVLKKHLPDKYQPEKLVQSLPGCITQTMMVDLNKYAEVLDEKGLEPSVEHVEFQKILETYGHRANIELDLGTERWREDPSYLLGLVKSYMVDQMYVRNLEDYESKRKQAEHMIEDICNDLISMGKTSLAKKMKKIMVNYRYGVAMREYPKSDIVRFLELGRKALFDVGHHLVKSGSLDKATDVFFLYSEEIYSGQDLKALVAEHKEIYEKEMKRTSIPRMVLSNGATYYTSTVIDPNADVLKGMALSPGSYEGTIRVVFDPKTTALKEGEILVTESTNPAWTPLFAAAGAIIMEYGGPMSHGGIVAREYGIPAVVGIPSATAVLKDGQRVRVNGETGIIEILTND
ncbi:MULTISPECIES: PEP/pyruvate-binding domain-containing protein [unclassified Fusibacter]|uniref:PEP/pyruvate-binding domain-containing protein n=1 Tax=unclassified Fusibacter TaxID=2624464 RepID=UPI001011EB7C|nr:MULTISPECIES: PEP/pyruvate-binding domain-containing protein [unclassified Fusibacter]MCK8060249.1 PEP-utilizing enzyme [Fusibacter sp. A2]NPE20464.1 hypothetical protein [Fusibacter sp. A1]RXV63669.1 hypothetical protein DWB64_01440 [Fusibacter sp. A1]